jgi:hypothetical protein
VSGSLKNESAYTDLDRSHRCRLLLGVDLQTNRRFSRKEPSGLSQMRISQPVNLNTYRGLSGFDHGFDSGQISSMKKHYGSVPGLNEYADKLSKDEAAERKMWITQFHELESASKGGGIICQFERSDGKTSEMGLLALKDGEVVKRCVWLVNYIAETNTVTK